MFASSTGELCSDCSLIQVQSVVFSTTHSNHSCDPIVELLEEIQKLNKSFMSDEKRVRNANKALEDSIDTRQKAKHKLSMCSDGGDLALLEKKAEELSAVDLNRKVRINQNCHMTSTETQILTWRVT